jgi:equilibrative nucleoside transporter 1/2/3
MAASLSPDGSLTVWLTIGQGAAGVGVVALRFLTKALIGEARAAVSTMVFFLMGFVWVLLAIFVFIAMLRQQQRRASAETSAAAVNYMRMEDAAEDGDTKSVSKLAVLKQLWPQAFSVCLVFTTCISCFPGLTASLQSTTFHLGDWFPLALVATYNVGDLIGKTAPQYISFFSKGRRASVALPLAAICHVCFVPAFVLRESYPSLGDWYAFSAVAMLGLTTGYIGCSSMMLGPAQCANGAEREVAGTMDTLFLVGGLTLGSLVGMAISLVKQA